MSQVGTLLPFKSAEIKEFWDGISQHKFLAQQCQSCSEKFFPPQNHCPKCLSKEFDWFELSGKGKIYSFTEPRITRSPFIVAAIDLEEGFSRIYSRIQTQDQQLEIGDSVEISFFIHDDEPLFEFVLKK